MNEHTEELTQYLAQLADRQVSLVDGLRAAADDCSSPRVAAALREMAGQMEQGRSLGEILAAQDALLSAPVRGLLLAAARTGRLGEALTELVEQQRAAVAARRSIVAALAYPLIVLGLGCLVLAGLVMWVTAPFEAILSDFGLDLPMLTLVLFWWRDHGPLLAAAVVVLVLLALLVVRFAGGRAAVWRLAASVPLFGPLWLWTGLAEWLGLIAVLVHHRVPLPEALRLSAAGIRNPLVSQHVRQLAEGAEGGQTLSQMFSAIDPMPASLVPLLRWGENKGLLDEALRVGHEMLQARVRRRSLMLRVVTPPAVFIAVACGVIFVMGALFLPLVSMIQGLS
jgi:type II secretory pathway component PulF